MRDAKDIARGRGMDHLAYQRMSENTNAPRATQKESILVTQSRKIKELLNEKKAINEK